MSRPRRKDYTPRGIRRVPCVKCGKPAKFQWSICADRQVRAICPPCDIELNEIVMLWCFGETARPKIEAYRQRVLASP